MKKEIVIAVLVVGAVIAITFGLASLRPQQPPTSSPSPQGSASSESASGAAPDTVVMRVNGEPVTEREFQLFVASLPEQMQAVFSSGAGRKQAAEQLVRMKVLEQEGVRRGADQDPDVAARMKFGHANVVVDYAIRKLAASASDAQLRAEYEKERDKFELLNLSHILIAVQGGQVPSRSGQPLSTDAAMQKAQSIEKALQSGADFAALARTQSDDAASAQQGGMLGAIPLVQLPPDIASVVSKLKPGQLSTPVRSQFGIHIFKLNERRMQTLEDVKPMLQQKVQQTTVTSEVDKLQKAARVEFDPKFFRADAGVPQGLPPGVPPGTQPGARPGAQRP